MTCVFMALQPKKRLALPQQPNLYLEPKWLRYQAISTSTGPLLKITALHIIARGGCMVTRAAARESQAHRAEYRTSLGGPPTGSHISVHFPNGLPRFGSHVLDFRVRSALCGGLRRTIQPAQHPRSSDLRAAALDDVWGWLVCKIP